MRASGKRAPIERLGRWLAGAGLLFVLAVFAPFPAKAEGSGGEEPVFTIEFNNGKITPLRIEVPANQRFVLELRNTGGSPVEFESSELRKEKVVAAGTTASLVFRALDPGEYPFFDDFHPGAPQAVLVAK
ncbi:MAG TPA: cupredoxin domain-containing protein [Methylocella sp.]|nr:cupredoxin domain-containing protein [Methylocella sp.]